MVATALILASITWSGRRVLPVVIAVVALSYPVPALVLAAVWTARHHQRSSYEPTPDEEARFLEGIASEARGGASPRQAVIRVATHQRSINAGAAVRAARLGLDSAALSRAFSQALPLNGRLAGAAWAISSEVGAPFAPVMTVLAERASSRGRLQRERHALTAQARATAWIVAGLPVLLVAVLWATGRLSLGNSWSIAAVGLVLQIIGVGLVLLMLRSQP